MKKVIAAGCAIVAGFAAAIVIADSVPQPVADCGVSVTNTSTTLPLNGYLELVRIESAANWTGTVAVAVSGETVLTVTTTGTNLYYRPRLQINNAVGATIVGATNSYERAFLAGDKIKTTVTSVGNTNNVTVTYKIQTAR
jgi:hypothetical protein